MKNLGLKRGTVHLVQHKDSWHQIYASEAKQLQEALSIEPSHIQHVGSTAIPDILAKPILDIGICVDSFNIVEAWIGPLERLGYVFKGFEPDMPQRRFFMKGSEELREVYLHIVDNEEFRKLVTFRDSLIASRGLAKEYSDLKKKLATTNKNNRSQYTHLKDQFITEVLSGK